MSALARKRTLPNSLIELRRHFLRSRSAGYTTAPACATVRHEIAILGCPNVLTVLTAAVNFVVADGIGTPRSVNNSSGAQIWQWPYQANPFGEKQPAGANGYTLNLRYPGQYFDLERGFAYNLNRDYDAATGRYAESDPKGLQAGPSTYVYVGGNPLSFIDPQGLETFRSQFNPAPGSALNVPTRPDYFHFAVGYYVGTANVIITRNGTIFLGGGAAHGTPKSVVGGTFGFAFTAGKMIGCGEKTGEEVDNFVAGASSGGSYFNILGGGVSWNSSGIATEGGFGTPGVSFQAVQYMVPVMQAGAHW